MKHYGDITKIKGSDVPIVDIVCGGSPCQDLSVAGLRKGIQHSDLGDGETTRSGLFMEQIRVFKEMRNESLGQLRMRGANVDVRSIRPRFFVWENVPGALSSPNKDRRGEDFRCVLEEVCRIADKDATIPLPKEGKWSTSGCIMGSGEFGVYSVAWRISDAQFWGVAQRRKRIALVGDFGGASAPEILFERKGMSGDIEQSRAERQGAASTSERNIDEAISFQERAGCDGGAKEYSYNITEQEHCQPLTTNQSCKCLNPWDSQSHRIQSMDGVADALYSGEKSYGGGSQYVHDTKVYGISSFDSNAMKSPNPSSGIYEADTTRTLDLNGGNPACNQGGMIVLEGNGSRNSHKGDGYKESETMYTLNTIEQHAVCYSQDAYDKFSENEKSASLKASGGTYGGGSETITIQKVTGPLMASGYQKNGTQEAMNGMYVVQKLSEHCADVITKE